MVSLICESILFKHVKLKSYEKNQTNQFDPHYVLLL